MTPLQNLPPKVKASIEKWVTDNCKYMAKIDPIRGNTIVLWNRYGTELPEPAAIGLLTAWLESEGWDGCEPIKLLGLDGYFWRVEAQKVIGDKKHIVSHEVVIEKQALYNQKYECFWQAFEKVTKLMEEQE